MRDEDPDAGSGEHLARAMAASVLEAVDAFPAGAPREDLVRYLRGDTPDNPRDGTDPADAQGRLWFSKKKPLESLVEILVAEGLLAQEHVDSGPPRLTVTADGTRFLADPDAADVRLAGFGQGADPGGSPLSEDESELFERLRTLRNTRAEERDVPPYIICNNDVLKTIARRRPTSPPGLSSISGIGPAFMEDHADAFLDALDAEVSEEPTAGPEKDSEESAAAPSEETASEASSRQTVVDERGDGEDADDEGEETGEASDGSGSAGPDGGSPDGRSTDSVPTTSQDATRPTTTQEPASDEAGASSQGQTGGLQLSAAPSKAEAREVLSSVFGHEDFLPGQWEVIERILGGGSAVAVFPTGGGKSLCYQLPAIAQEGTTLVVSPLKALMKDQVDALQAVGVAAAREDSSTSYQASQETLTAFAEGDLDVLYVAPERFNNDRFVSALAEARIDLLAIDEAHCISEWGHSFRPDYLKLARYADEWEIPQVLCLTATATPRVVEDMCTSFDIPEDDVVRLPSHRDNLDLAVEHVQPGDRYDALVRTLQEDPVGPTIVYAKRRKTTERLAEALAEDGFPAKPFHAGLDDEEKHATQDWFMGADEAVIVATIAFGMGVDKPDIRRVVHHNLPSSLEAYAQQVGRAGRDGAPSRCTLLYCPDDVNLSTNYEWGSTPTTEQFHAVLTRLFEPDVGETQTLDFLAYEKDLGVDRNTVQTLVALLENEDLLAQHTPVNRSFRYRLLEPEAEVQEALPEEDRRLLEAIQAAADHKRKWSHLDVPSFTDEHGVDRSRVGDLLDTLAQEGYAETQARDYAHPCEVLARPDDLEALAEDYRSTFKGLEDRAVERVRDVPRRLSEAPCLWQAVADHFGEAMDDACGHCSTCRDGEAPNLPLPEEKPIPEEAHEHVAAALEEAPGLAEEPMTVAEFLCGRYSIGVRTHGLHRLDGYRSLEYHALERVLGWVEGEVGEG